MKFLFSLMQAIAVVPLPMQLSRTPPHIGISTYKILDKGDWLLRRVEGIGRMFFIKADNAPWEFLI